MIWEVIFRDWLMHAAVGSAAIEVGETPRTKNPVEANLLVKYVGFRGTFELRFELLAGGPASNVSELNALADVRFIRMRPKSGFAVSQIWE